MWITGSNITLHLHSWLLGKSVFSCAVFFSFGFAIFHLLFGVWMRNVLNGVWLLSFLYSKLCIIFPHSCLGFLWQRIQNFRWPELGVVLNVLKVIKSFNEATINQSSFLFLVYKMNSQIDYKKFNQFQFNRFDPRDCASNFIIPVYRFTC